MKAADASRQHISSILSGHAIPSETMLNRLIRAARTLEIAASATTAGAGELLAQVRIIGIRKCAGVGGINAGHLTRLVSGKRKLTKSIFGKLKQALAIECHTSSEASGNVRNGDD